MCQTDEESNWLEEIALSAFQDDTTAVEAEFLLLIGPRFTSCIWTQSFKIKAYKWGLHMGNDLSAFLS